MSRRQSADGSHDSREVETPPTPLWLYTPEQSPGPATVVTKKELRYKLNLFADWAAAPEVLPSPMQVEHVYRGPASSDWLVVSFMSKAVPGHNMLTWLEKPIRMTGFPSIQIGAKADPVPDLVAWNYEGHSTAYMAKRSRGNAWLYRFGTVRPSRCPALCDHVAQDELSLDVFPFFAQLGGERK